MNEKKYYWIKLKDSFMTSDTVDFLMSQDNGANYVVLYQMLCLKTVNTDGELSRKIGEILVPYDIDKIKRDCKYFELDTIRVALELYKNLGLVYVQENGIMKIDNFDNMVGSETQWAEKKRLYREKENERKKLEENKDNVSDNVLDNVSDNFRQEKEIRDKRLDIRYKDIKNNSSAIASQKKPIKHKYGEYKNVLLTDKEYNNLSNKYPDIKEIIKFYDELIEEKGYKAKSHNLAIQRWVVDAYKEKKQKVKSQHPRQDIEDVSVYR